jgi:hypothetical protein
MKKAVVKTRSTRELIEAVQRAGPDFGKVYRGHHRDHVLPIPKRIDRGANQRTVKIRSTKIW